ncbi:MAG: type II toxin-antitoxin system VapC family toxin [Rickettsiales bacterium]
MIGLDTNLLIRYIIRDDLTQTRAADRYIDSLSEDGISLFLNNIVLCELVRVLEVTYEYNKIQVVSVIEKILSTSQFLFEDTNAIWIAISAYKKSKSGFADSLIGTINKLSGCEKTATFDKKAAKLPDFELLNS